MIGLISKGFKYSGVGFGIVRETFLWLFFVMEFCRQF